ncbi:MAG TPA: hypothetical protein VES68_01820, partial [Candidatus Sulfotelmatobacter sp.]|nr:hypothetical protein [Candidatus Sulfotelmatobacter sp.]
MVKILKNQKGQALLIIVLVMVVALTVGLSVASRTITNLRNTREQVSSQKALSSAEAGVEQAIKNNVSVGQTLSGNFSGNTTYSTTIIQAGSGTSSFLLNGGSAVPKSDAIYVWLTPYSTNSANLWQNPWNGTLKVYWGNTSQSCNTPNSMPPALEIAVITGSKDNPTVSRYAYDPCSARQGVNNFSSPVSSVNTVSGTTLNYRADISVTNGLLVRVNPYYSTSNIG